MDDRYPIKTQEALRASLVLTVARRHPQITPIHLLPPSSYM